MEHETIHMKQTKSRKKTSRTLTYFLSTTYMKRKVRATKQKLRNTEKQKVYNTC